MFLNCLATAFPFNPLETWHCDYENKVFLERIIRVSRDTTRTEVVVLFLVSDSRERRANAQLVALSSPSSLEHGMTTGREIRGPFFDFMEKSLS